MVGYRVKLKGLKKNPDFNGQLGTVLDPNEGEPLVPGTVKVHLDMGPEVAAKPGNLEIVDPRYFEAMQEKESDASAQIPYDPLAPVETETKPTEDDVPNETEAPVGSVPDGTGEAVGSENEAQKPAAEKDAASDTVPPEVAEPPVSSALGDAETSATHSASAQESGPKVDEPVSTPPAEAEVANAPSAASAPAAETAPADTAAEALAAADVAAEAPLEATEKAAAEEAPAPVPETEAQDGQSDSGAQAQASAPEDAETKPPTAADTTEASQKEDFAALTVEKLKDKLRELKLPVSGNKAELVDRLEKHFAGP